MELRCPTCRALYKEGHQCHRCQCDLSILLMILDQAIELRNLALCLLREGKTKQALQAIQRSLLIHRNPNSEKIKAIIYASRGDFDKIIPYLTF